MKPFLDLRMFMGLTRVDCADLLSTTVDEIVRFESETIPHLSLHQQLILMAVGVNPLSLYVRVSRLMDYIDIDEMHRLIDKQLNPVNEWSE